MVKKNKKYKNLKLVISLIFMSLVLVVSVGGLTIIKGVNANENDDILATNTDIVEESDMVVADYVYSDGNQSKKEIIKIESVEQATNLINSFFTTKSYVVTSTGKMGVSGKVDGIMSYAKVCDLDYRDYFEHEASGRAYWEEGSKMGRFYNSFIETVYDQYMSMSGLNINNLSRFYYINDETFFIQHNRGVNFKNGFNVDQKVLNSNGISKSANADSLKNYGYKVRYFRWDINPNTVKNAALTKTIMGYKLDFELEGETAARDVYKRFVTWIPSNVLNSVSAGKFRYSFNFDRYGNVISFSRDETIKMGLTGKNVGFNLTGSGDLNFNFKYNVRTKDDSYKISVDSAFGGALARAGYSF